jgi:hypothetical protein
VLGGLHRGVVQETKQGQAWAGCVPTELSGAQDVPVPNIFSMQLSQAGAAWIGCDPVPSDGVPARVRMVIASS